MNYFIALISVVRFSWALHIDKTWNNYEATNLKNWNNEVAVNGLFFSANIVNPMAFYSHYDDVCQLVIPMNTDANDTNFSWTPMGFDSSHQVECPEQESGNTWWVDPNNWDLSSTSAATPHVERLPCSHETVMIRSSNDLYIILPTNPVQIGRFYWNAQTVHEYDFRSPHTREEYLKNFIVTGAKDLWEMIRITGVTCPNRTGCVCGTIVHFKETCKIIRKECNSSLTCENAITPAGHCCKICGCTITIDFDESNFVYDKLKEVVKKFFGDYESLSYHMSKQPGNAVQIVIVNTDGGENYDTMHIATGTLKSLLESDDASISHLTSSIYSVVPSCSLTPNSYGPLFAISRVMIPLFALAAFAILVVLLFQSKISLRIREIFKSSDTFFKLNNQMENNEEQSESPKQPEQESSNHPEVSKNIEPESHSEGKSENGTSSELDDDSVLVELT